MLIVAFSATAQVNFSGFATFGVTTSNSDDLIYRSSLTRWPEEGTNVLTDSLLGLQLNYQATDQFDFVVQSVLDNRDYDSVSDYINLAFLRYQANRNLSFRLGRMNYNAYMLSEYLNVGYTYMWAAPPFEFYAPSSYMRYIDGAELQYRWGVDSGIMQATFALGKSKANVLNVGSDSSLEFKYVANASLTYENDRWLIKGTLSYNRGKRTILPGLTEFRSQFEQLPGTWWPGLDEVFDDLDFEDKVIKYAALGVSYTNFNWIVKSELAIYDVHCCVTGDLAYGYFSLGYEFGAFIPYVTVAGLDSLYDELQIAPPNYEQIPLPSIQQEFSAIHAYLQETYTNTRMEQYSVSVGVRWDFTDSWAVKGQFSRYRINNPGYGLWGTGDLVNIDGDRSINVLSVNVTTVF